MSLLQPKLVLGIALIVSLFILVSLAQEMNRRWQVQHEVQRLEADVRDMRKSVIEMENLNHYFRTEDYQERLAREQLNYSAPGEKVVLIPEDQIPVEVASSEVVEVSRPASVPGRWWHVFFVDERPFDSLRSKS